MSRMNYRGRRNKVSKERKGEREEKEEEEKKKDDEPHLMNDSHFIVNIDSQLVGGHDHLVFWVQLNRSRKVWRGILPQLYHFLQKKEKMNE